MISEYKATDAMGNTIVMGQMYGYSQKSSGVLHITIGNAVRLTNNNKVSIEVEYRGSSLWEHDIESAPINKRYSNMISTSLFPVSNEIMPDWGVDA